MFWLLVPFKHIFFLVCLLRKVWVSMKIMAYFIFFFFLSFSINSLVLGSLKKKCSLVPKDLFGHNWGRRREKKWITEWGRKEKKTNISFMFGNREKRRKEKKRIHFYFICLVCNKKGNEKKNVCFFLTFLLI